MGTCAERVAFGKAVTEGHRKFRAVAVSTDISPPASPCGMCRQLLVFPLSYAMENDCEERRHGVVAGSRVLMDWYSIREFVELDTPIFMFDKDGAFLVMRLEQVSVFYTSTCCTSTN